MNAFLVKYGLKIGALVAAALLVWYYGHTRYEAGRDKVQSAFDLAVAQHEAALLEARLQVENTERHWAGVVAEERHAYQSVVNTERARGADLARRLRDYQGRAARCTALPEAPGAAGGSSEAPGEPSLDGRIGAVTERIFGACRVEAAQLNAVLDIYEEVSQ